MRIAVLPFRLNSANPIGFRTGTLDELLAERIEISGEVGVVARSEVTKVLGDDLTDRDRSDSILRAFATQLGIDAIVTGSLTELAGRFSLDVRLTPARRGAASTSLVVTANSDRELLERLGELAERIVAATRGRSVDRILEVRIEGAGSIESELSGRLGLREGAAFDPTQMDTDRRALASDPRIANVETRSIQREDGIVVVYEVLLAERILGERIRTASGDLVAEVVIRGNKRVQEDAIRVRIGTAVARPLDRAQISWDVRSIFKQGFFRDVSVSTEETPLGVRVIFDVTESPVVREIAIIGNEEIDGDKIKDVLTLTTGSPLDFPLLRENNDRITALYRSEGYYLAEVGYEIEEITDGSIAINFEVQEKEKLKLRTIEFSGNEAFSDNELAQDFTTKVWRFYSYATSWFDKTGTYSEPVFLRDLRLVEKKYTDEGYVQSRVGEPEVIA
ncbi:MAG: POTRA domain-containing protein, partial [Myxococcota bacterium]